MHPGKRRKSLVSILTRRIESCDLRNPDTDQLVDYLCSKYPDYNRSKRRWLSKQVSDVLLESSCRKSTPFSSDVSDLHSAEKENDGPKRKKTKKSDNDDEKLLQLERRHMKNRRCEGNIEDDGEEEEEESSTSGDWIFGQEFKPEFDLLNSQLREKYVAGAKNGKDENTAVQAELMEVEVVDDKAPPKLMAQLLNDVGGREVGVSPAMVKKGVDSGGTGPMFKDLGGMRDVVKELKRKVIVPFYHPKLPQCLGVKPTTGILLHGPPGCGKTKLAHAIANETGVPFYKISATELVSGISGASEENIRDLFTKAYRTAPSIVFIDEIDVIGSKRENLQREMERRIVTQLMACMDESHRPEKHETGLENSDSSRPGFVLVIGATNRPDAVDPALRRPGRFDREILLGVPDESARAEILSVLTRHLKVVGTFDLQKIARATPGFVGADLAALADMAGNLAMERIMDHREHILVEHADGAEAEDWWKQPWSDEEMEQLSITMEDFENAVAMVQPSSKREGFSAIPSVKWEDVGGLQELRQVFERDIIGCIKFPELYENFGVDLQPGFLLYGPPGCGKTLIAKAVANEAGANFIHIKGPELLNKYVGESELAMRKIFSRARTCAPCILFFDEVDALTTKRGKEGGWVVERLVNQLLIELDGAEKRKGIYVIGATNRPEVIDDAIVRPGRFGKRLYVPLPSADERGLILTALAKKKPIDTGVDLMAIGSDISCENYSGADLSALVNEAAMAALEDKLASEDSKGEQTQCTIKESHFKRALSKITPSVSEEQRQYYQHLSEVFKDA